MKGWSDEEEIGIVSSRNFVAELKHNISCERTTRSWWPIYELIKASKYGDGSSGSAREIL